jgi:hypothetical protein
MTNQNRFFTGIGALAMLSLLFSGCGAANNLVNSAIPEINNLLGLDNIEIDAAVGGLTRATIVGGLDRTGQFNNQTLPQGSSLKFAKLRQRLDRPVRVTVPAGKNLPASFTLRNLELTITISDTALSTSGKSSLVGPVVYNRIGATAQYEATSDPEPEVALESEAFKTFRTIVTEGPEPNAAAVKLRYDADDTELPSGSTIRFKMVGGKTKVGI